MSPGTLRLAFAALALIALWVIVYWWTPAPSQGIDIAFAPPIDGPEIVTELPPPEPAQPALPQPEPAPTTPAPAEPAPKAERPPATVVPPSFYRYTVRPGDTARRISQRFYGVTDHWQQVMKANPKTDFQRLREGMEILVPVNPRNIQGIPADPSKRRQPGSPESQQTEQNAREVTGPAGFAYKVEPGDTLSGLAQRFYGRGSAWRAIVAANREALGPEGEKLRPGMTITIPPAPEPAQQKAPSRDLDR